MSVAAPRSGFAHPARPELRSHAPLPADESIMTHALPGKEPGTISDGALLEAEPQAPRKGLCRSALPHVICLPAQGRH